jgi:hypothetical protein
MGKDATNGNNRRLSGMIFCCCPVPKMTSPKMDINMRSSSYSQAAWLVTQSVTTTLLDDKNRTCTTGCWGEPGMTVCTRSGCAYDVLTATSSEKTF